MAVFCTRCGASNAVANAFCDQCGTPLRTSAPAQQRPPAPPSRALPGRAPRNTRTIAYFGAALGAALLLGAGGLYFALSPPAPTSARLLEAARAGHGDLLPEKALNELCLSNLDYSNQPLTVAQYDRSTQNWLAALVAAGLYQPGVPAMGSGFFAQPVVQYAAKPELSKWLQGRRLCLSQKVEITDVVQIGTPTEEKLEMRGSRNANAPTVLSVPAKLVLQAVHVAPWLGKAAVQGPVLERLADWKYQDGKLQKQVPDTFGLRDGQWATGPAYTAELRQQLEAAHRAHMEQEHVQGAPSASALGGMFARLGQIFSFGGHPLEGTWRMDSTGLEGSMGDFAAMSGASLQIRFTRDAMEIPSGSVKCSFQVDGQRVKVTPEGQSTSQIFEMRDKDTAVVDMGVLQMTYKRVP